ncbi:hypothetical protein [Absidia glauca]|uniref:mRNA 3'-end-processing protein n=1 Tax=Absidia glauca TaxID=4829 RepID=A0A168MHW1_ABSGL|nr:hypothetical protein [Absidia glauca]
MLISPIQYTDHTNIKFDFEDFIKEELGLDLDSFTKREDPESKQKECPWYARGFCKHGPHCRHKHVRKLVCQNYLTGFCPDGLNCSNGHPKYELPLVNTNDDSQHQQQQGHSQNSHRQQANGQSYQQQHGQQPFLGQQHQQRFGNSDNRQGFQQQQQQQQQRTPFRKLEDVTCYKCGEQGHYANKCPNGRAGGGGGGP